MLHFGQQHLVQDVTVQTLTRALQETRMIRHDASTEAGTTYIKMLADGKHVRTDCDQTKHGPPTQDKPCVVNSAFILQEFANVLPARAGGGTFGQVVPIRLRQQDGTDKDYMAKILPIRRQAVDGAPGQKPDFAFNSILFEYRALQQMSARDLSPKPLGTFVFSDWPKQTWAKATASLIHKFSNAPTTQLKKKDKANLEAWHTWRTGVTGDTKTGLVDAWGVIVMDLWPSSLMDTLGRTASLNLVPRRSRSGQLYTDANAAARSEYFDWRLVQKELVRLFTETAALGYLLWDLKPHNVVVGGKDFLSTGWPEANEEITQVRLIDLGADNATQDILLARDASVVAAMMQVTFAINALGLWSNRTFPQVRKWIDRQPTLALADAAWVRRSLGYRRMLVHGLLLPALETLKPMAAVVKRVIAIATPGMPVKRGPGIPENGRPRTGIPRVMAAYWSSKYEADRPFDAIQARINSVLDDKHRRSLVTVRLRAWGLPPRGWHPQQQQQQQPPAKRHARMSTPRPP